MTETDRQNHRQGQRDRKPETVKDKMTETKRKKDRQRHGQRDRGTEKE